MLENEEYSDVEEEEQEDLEDEEEENSEEDDDDEDEEQNELEEANGDADDDQNGKVSENEELEGEEQENKEEEVSGWADSIAKILKSNKPKNKKDAMLSRARKDYEVSKTVAQFKQPNFKKPQDTFEIVKNEKSKLEDSAAEKVKVEEKSNKVDDNILSLKTQRKLELKQKKLELAWENLSRLSAEKTDPIMEKDLLKIATKGVVQLFNAISMQQKTIKSKLKSSRKSEFQKDKILNQTKDIFDSAMTKSKRMKVDGTMGSDIKIKNEESDEDDFVEEEDQPRKRKQSDMSKRKKPTWNALHEDFMLGAKLKDWDKDSDSD